MISNTTRYDQTCLKRKWIEHKVFTTFKNVTARFFITNGYGKLDIKLIIKVNYRIGSYHFDYGLNITVLAFHMAYSGPSCEHAYFEICSNSQVLPE